MDSLEIDDYQFFSKKNFVFRDFLGKGGFGKVFLVWCNIYNCYFAVKKVQENRFKQGEVEALIKIQDPRVVSLYSAELFNGYYYLVMEYCPSTLLALQTITANDDQALFKYTKEVLLAIKACHDRNIAHRDIKPGNFLLDQYNRVKVGDFGLAVDTTEYTARSFSGTLGFLPPEIINKRKEIDYIKADIWALGVTFFYMATNKLPFFINERNFTYVDMNEINSIEYQKLVLSCLEYNPAKRPTIDELLNFKLFTKPKHASSMGIYKNKSNINFSLTRFVKPKLVAPCHRLKNLTPVILTAKNI